MRKLNTDIALMIINSLDYNNEDFVSLSYDCKEGEFTLVYEINESYRKSKTMIILFEAEYKNLSKKNKALCSFLGHQDSRDNGIKLYYREVPYINELSTDIIN